MKKENTLSPTFSRFFDDFLKNEFYDWGHNNSSATGTTIPAVNIKKTNDYYEVEMAAPGMEKKDFKIELNGNRLTISSERENQMKENEESMYVKREFSYQAFERSFTLAENLVDGDKIKASYNNGVLVITIPLREEAKVKPARTIKIQ